MYYIFTTYQMLLTWLQVFKPIKLCALVNNKLLILLCFEDCFAQELF